MDKGFALGPVIHSDGDSTLFSDADLTSITEAGATVVRFDLSLFHHSGWDDAIIGLYNGVIERLYDQGVRVIGILGSGTVPGPHNQQADWNANPAELGGSGANPFVHAFVQHARRVVARVPGIAHWEIWNEPNGWSSHPRQDVYEGHTFIYPSIYATLLRQTYQAIKAVRPDSHVITGGLLGHTNGGQRSRENSGADYLDRLYHALAPRDAAQRPEVAIPFDAIGLHFYVDQGEPPAWQPPEQSVRQLTDDIKTYLGYVHDVVAMHEGVQAARSIYATEVGWRTAADLPHGGRLHGVSPLVQAQSLAAAYDVLRAHPLVAAACWFSLRDDLTGDLPYGVLKFDGSPKPALTAFQTVPIAGERAAPYHAAPGLAAPRREALVLGTALRYAW